MIHYASNVVGISVLGVEPDGLGVLRLEADDLIQVLCRIAASLPPEVENHNIVDSNVLKMIQSILFMLGNVPRMI